MSATLLRPERVAAPRAKSARRTMSRAAFYLHLWLGVLSTVALIAISVTGILLNHKRGLGLMPDVPHEPTGEFASAISIEQMAAVALAAAPPEARPGWSPGDPVDIGLIDRMDVRPRNGFVKVRLRDNASTEMTVDINTGQVVHIGRRADVFLEKLHSGEIFGGQPFVILSDVAAVALVLTLITGYWLWLVPKLHRGTGRDDSDHS
jgi:hypothetical protein